MIADLSLADAPANWVAHLARLLIQAVLESEHAENDGMRDIAYIAAGESFIMGNRTEAYRSSAELQDITRQLEEIGTRDPKSESRAHTRTRRINELNETGDFEEIRRLLPGWRSQDESIYNRAIFDALEILSQSHTAWTDWSRSDPTVTTSLLLYGRDFARLRKHIYREPTFPWTRELGGFGRPILGTVPFGSADPEKSVEARRVPQVGDIAIGPRRCSPGK